MILEPEAEGVYLKSVPKGHCLEKYLRKSRVNFIFSSKWGLAICIFLSLGERESVGLPS